MELLEAITPRRSIREYREKGIMAGDEEALRGEIDICNEESGLNMQLVVDDPLTFGSFMARHSGFKNVRNYIAIVGPKKDRDLLEKAGYYGERIVLLAQTLGLGTCWVGLTFSKKGCLAEIKPGEKLVCVISLGYPAETPVPRPSKSPREVSKCDVDVPKWFSMGVGSALMAPTAMNQQKFFFELKEGKVLASSRKGPFSAVDLGIAKYHFEVAAGKENFEWA